jgi:hypothetical protein
MLKGLPLVSNGAGAVCVMEVVDGVAVVSIAAMVVVFDVVLDTLLLGVAVLLEATVLLEVTVLLGVAVTVNVLPASLVVVTV